MTALLPDAQLTEDDCRAASDRVYRLSNAVHASAARRAIADAEHQRVIEHAGQFEAFRDLCEQTWRDHPGTDGLALAWGWLEQFGAAWDATDARYLAELDAAIRKLDSLGERMDNPNLGPGEQSAQWCDDCSRIVVQPGQHDCARGTR